MRKILKITGAILTSFLVVLFIVDAGLVWGIAHHRPKVTHADSVIVFGAAINTPALVNRTLEGLEFYELGKVDTMVLSGGKISDADISEAQFMEKVIKKNATKDVQYILEDQSHNTADNIWNSKAALQREGKGTDSVVVVSDAFHLARAVLLAKRAGFKHVYWSAPSSGYYSRPELRYYYIREFIAILSYIPTFIRGH